MTKFISLPNGYRSKIGIEKIDIRQMHKLITKDKKVKDRTLATLQVLTDESAYSSAKDLMHAVELGASEIDGNTTNEGVTSISPYLQIDLDKIAEDEKEDAVQYLHSLPYVQLVGISGKGVKAVAVIDRPCTSIATAAERTEATKLNQMFAHRISAEISELGYKIDPSVFDLSRKFILWHDPAAKLKPDDDIEPLKLLGEDYANYEASQMAKPHRTLSDRLEDAASDLTPELLKEALMLNDAGTGRGDGWMNNCLAYIEEAFRLGIEESEVVDTLTTWSETGENFNDDSSEHIKGFISQVQKNFNKGDRPKVGVGTLLMAATKNKDFQVKLRSHRALCQLDVLDADPDAEKIYYSRKERSWYHKNAEGGYFGEGAAEFTKAMYYKTGLTNEAAKELMHRSKMSDGFDAVVQVAGWESGLHSYKGNQLLVVKGYQKPEAVAGDFPLTKNILKQLFGSEQLKHFYGQLKHFAAALTYGNHAQIPAMVFCGEKNSGKSLLAEVIIQNLFNARVANPKDVLKGGSTFNLSMLGSELLLMDDVKGSFGKEARAGIEGALKELVATTSKEIHPKGFEKIPVWATQLLLFMLNTNDDDLAILPDPSKDGSGDKFSLYRVHKAEMPMPTYTPEQQRVFREALKSESAAFLHFLLNEWEIEDKLRHRRWGCKTFHNPELYDQLAGLSDDADFEGILTAALWSGNSDEMYEGSAGEILKKVIDQTQNKKGLHTMLRGVTSNFNPASFASKLGRSKLDWVKRDTHSRPRKWILTRPTNVDRGDMDDIEMLG